MCLWCYESEVEKAKANKTPKALKKTKLESCSWRALRTKQDSCCAEGTGDYRKKWFCRSQHLLCQQYKKRVLTTGGGLQCSLVILLTMLVCVYLKWINPAHNQNARIISSQPLTPPENLNGDKESSCPEVQQATGWHLPPRADAICWLFLQWDWQALTALLSRWLSFSHSQATAWLCPQNQGWHFAIPSHFSLHLCYMF